MEREQFSFGDNDNEINQHVDHMTPRINDVFDEEDTNRLANRVSTQLKEKSIAS
jgi:hypothetical protein